MELAGKNDFPVVGEPVLPFEHVACESPVCADVIVDIDSVCARRHDVIPKACTLTGEQLIELDVGLSGQPPHRVDMQVRVDFLEDEDCFRPLMLGLAMKTRAKQATINSVMQVLQIVARSI